MNTSTFGQGRGRASKETVAKRAVKKAKAMRIMAEREHETIAGEQHRLKAEAAARRAARC